MGKHVLVMRTDRIGDVLLTTPIAEAIKRNRPGWRVTFLVRKGLAELVLCHPGVDGVIAIADGDRSWDEPLRILGRFRRERVDVALAVSPTLRNALAAWLARVPVRIGTRYRAWSFLFNRRVAHHRRPSEKHEVEYNFDLLEPLGIRPGGEAPRIEVPEWAASPVRETLEREVPAAAAGRIVAVHPGSGGSSVDWPPECFAALVDRLSSRGDVTVLLTGSREEKARVGDVAGRVDGSTPVRLDGRLSLVGLAALYRECDLLVANSTGPLHLAMAVGTPVVGLYCRLPTRHPTRWGPYGPTPHAVLTPDETVCADCAKGRAPGDCMAGIDPEAVARAAFELLDRKGGVG
jgi:ADP-heptose:LPS heptosyltransferase